MNWLLYFIVCGLIATIRTIYYTKKYILPNTKNAFKTQILGAILIHFILVFAFAPIVIVVDGYELKKKSKERKLKL